MCVFKQIAVLSVIALLATNRLLADTTSGLIAHYPLNGDAKDATHNGHDGTVVNATPTENRFGQTGKALLFDGINSFVRVPDSRDLRLATGDFTVSAWIFETERDVNYNDCIISKRGPVGPGDARLGGGRGWIFTVRGLREPDQTGRLFYQASGGVDPRALSTGTIALNQWHQVAVVYHHGSASVDMFIDGEWDSSTPNISAPNPDTKVALHIGNDSQLAYNNAYVFHGKLSDVRIYDRALNTVDVNELYSTGFFQNHTQLTGKALTHMYGGLAVGEKVITESSADLIHWTPIRTNITTSTTLSMTNFINPNVTAEFFRVSVTAPEVQ